MAMSRPSESDDDLIRRLCEACDRNAMPSAMMKDLIAEAIGEIEMLRMNDPQVESLKRLCDETIDNFNSLNAIVDVCLAHIKMLEKLCLKQAKEIRRLGGTATADMTTLTDQQTARILKAIMESQK